MSTTSDLYSLLGLSPDADVQRLKHAYEEAMATATRRHDWDRATRLSAAFDRLPASVRLTAYPGRERDARRWSETDERRSRSRRRRTGRSRVRWGLVATIVVVAVLIGAVVIGLVRYWQRQNRSDTGPPGIRPVSLSTVGPPTRAAGPRMPSSRSGQRPAAGPSPAAAAVVPY